MSAWPIPIHACLARRVSTRWAPTRVAGTQSPVAEAIIWTRTARAVKVDRVTRNVPATVNHSLTLSYCTVETYSLLSLPDIDECRAGNVCGDHGCSNLVGSYRCECRIGFIFNSITKLCQGTAGVPQCLVFTLTLTSNVVAGCSVVQRLALLQVPGDTPPPPSVSPVSALWWTVQGVSQMRWGSSPPGLCVG